MPAWKHWDSHLHIHPFKPEWWVDKLILQMDRNGVEVGALGGSALFTPEEDDHVQDAVRRYPGRFLPTLCHVDFNLPSELARVTSELDSGRWAGVGEVFLETFRATHLSFEKQGVPMRMPYPIPRDGAGNAVLGGLIDHCTELGMPVLIHCEMASALEDLLRRHPRSTIVWAHCDYATPPLDARRVMEQFPWLHADFGPMIRCGYWDTQHGSSNWIGEWRDFWRGMCRDFADRMLLGTDTIMEKYLDNARYRHIYESFEDFMAPLPREAVEAIVGGNLRRLCRGYIERHLRRS